MPTSAALQRRGVVDAVAHEADHVPLVLQGVDDALLVRRGELGKDGGLSRPPRPAASSVIASISGPSRMCSTGRPTCWQMLRGDQLVVAGQDLDVHVVLRAVWLSASGAVSLGGSRKARKPSSVRSDSSCTE